MRRPVDSHLVSPGGQTREIARQRSAPEDSRLDSRLEFRARVEKQVISRVRWAWSGIDDKLGIRVKASHSACCMDAYRAGADRRLGRMRIW